MLSSVPILAAEPSMRGVFVAVCLGAGLGLLELWRRNTLSLQEILLGGLLLRIAFFPLDPGLSDDMFRYVWDGWLQWEGINPYRYAPADAALTRFQDSELYHQLNSRQYYSVYPPFSQLIFAIGGWAGSNWLPGYYVIKAVFVLLEAGALWMLSRLTSPRNLLLYAWNPLVLVEVAGQGHTEAAAVFFIVGAVWAVRARRGRLASLAVASAGLVKLYPLVVGPFLIRRFGWQAVWPGTLLATAVSLPYAATYVVPHMAASVDLYFKLFEFNAGPYYAVKETLAIWTGADWSKQIGPAFRMLFLLSLPVLYALDARRNWSFPHAALIAIGTFFVFSTTVHPWYLLSLLPLAVVHRRPSWAWLWLGITSLGTYLHYVQGPYWPWVIAGWGGSAVLGLGAIPAVRALVADRSDAVLQWLQKKRGGEKADEVVRLLRATGVVSESSPRTREINPHAPESQMGDPSTTPDSGNGSRHSGAGPTNKDAPEARVNGRATRRGLERDELPDDLRILDLGAGEGYVGTALRDEIGAEVILADVVDLNRTDLPHLRYDGRSLPLESDAVDVTILYFVLHHAADPGAVLREALRVSRHRVVVVESIVTGAAQHRLLRFLDRIANRVRSAGRLRAQEEDLTFRSAEEWTKIARRLGARIRYLDIRDHPIHPQGFYLLEPISAGTSTVSVDDAYASASGVEGSDTPSR